MCPKVSQDYKHKKKQFIIEAAERVFIRKGFDAVSMQDIVDECDISRGSLYSYFSSTEEILKALLEVDISKELKALDELMEKGTQALAIINLFLEKQKSEILNVRDTLTPAAYEYFIKSVRDKSIEKYLKQRHSEALDILIKVMKYGVERKEFFSDLDVKEVSKYIVTFIEGLIITSISVGIDENSLNKQIDMFCTALRGILNNQI